MTCLLPLVILAYMVGGYFVILAPGKLYNALVSEDLGLFRSTIIHFAATVTVVLAIKMCRGLLRESCANRLRYHLTEQLHKLYLGANDFEMGYTPPPYYKIAFEKRIDNPDQRVVTDAREFSSTLLNIIAGGGMQGPDSGGLIEAISSILFYTGQTFLRLGWFGVATAYVWSAIVSAMTIFVVNRTSPLVFTQERLEADLRYAHAQLRRHAEEIAFLRGSPFERRSLDRRLRHAIKNQWAIIWRHFWLNGLQYGFAYYISLVMYLSLAFAVHTRVFNSGLGFPADDTGGKKAQWISQTGGVFIQLLFSFTMLIQLGTSISAFVPNIERLASFVDAVTHGEEDLREIALNSSDENTIPLIQTPTLHAEHTDSISQDGKIKLDHVRTKCSSAQAHDGVTLDVDCGDNVLLYGPTGCGKTSILRAVRGLWNPTNGQIQVPRKERDLTFSPQTAYLPAGKYALKDVVAYPNTVDTSDNCNAKIREALKAVGWPTDRNGRVDIEDQDNWMTRLSPGEMQLIAVARVLFLSPRFAILDEPTSALDHKNERRVLDALKNSGISTLLVGHGEPLKALHDRAVNMTPGMGDGNQDANSSDVVEFDE